MQRCVTELLHEEGNGLIDIRRRSVRVYEADVVETGTVRRWVRRFESGDRDVHDKARSGHPHAISL